MNKRLIIWPTLWMALSFATAQTPVRIEPFDFQDDANVDTLTSSILQIESAGDQLHIRTENDYILTIDHQGRMTGKTESPGFGGRAYQHPTAFAISGDQMVVLNPTESFFLYDSHAFQHYFRGEHYQNEFITPDMNAAGFGFNGKQIVVPADPKSKKAAVVYDLKGNVLKTFGEPAVFPESLREQNPAIGSSFWTWRDGVWYMLFKFKPLVRKYNERFELIGEFEVSDSSVSAWQEGLEAGGPHRFIPCFADVKVHRGDLYFMCLDTLVRADGDTGKTLQTWKFFGRGPDFEQVPPEMGLTFMSFAFLNDDTVVLGHPAMPWNHDLWKATLGPSNLAVVQGRTD